MVLIKKIEAQKGGVGKTTTVINLGAALAELGLKVLLCDLDPQCHLSMALGIHKEDSKRTLYEVFEGNKKLSEVIHKKGKYDVVPCSYKLKSADYDNENIFKTALEKIKDNYDYIIIDSPSDHGIMYFNGIMAANEILLAVQTEPLSKKSLPVTFAAIQVAQKHNENIVISGVINTMYDQRRNTHKKHKKIIDEYFGDITFKTAVRYTGALADAQDKEKDIFRYNKHSNGAKDYFVLALEMLVKDGKLIKDYELLREYRPAFMRYSDGSEYNKLINNII